MNFLKYDYYGNYDNNNSSVNKNHFSVNEIQKKQREKEKNRMKIYEIISKRCFEKIKASSLNEETFCFFQLPEYLPGLPLYNMTECVMFLLNVLHSNGFHARYCDHFYIYITWVLPKPNFKLIEPPKEKKTIVDDLDLKYKPIEKYQSSNNFLFNNLVKNNKK